MRSLVLFGMFLLVFSVHAQALNVCTMTFNSSDEKEAMQAVYASDPSVTFTELVPSSNDSQWLKKACDARVRCDVLLISGHFGGLFFGEKTLPTLSMDEMFAQSCSEGCLGIFSDVKSVYLMGCNTLASKKADHRTIEDYLRVLVWDGFPLENAKTVAAARYADFGESIDNKMRMIFPSAEVVFGFDSTGPKGATAGPLLKKALLASSPQDRARIGASPTALMSAFKGKNARLVKGDAAVSPARALRCDLRSEQPSLSAVQQAFTPKEIRKNFDAAIELKNTDALKNHLEQNPAANKEFVRVAKDILGQTTAMLGLEKKIYDLMKDVGLSSAEAHKQFVTNSFNDFLSGGLDYLRAEQLCDMAQTTPEIDEPARLKMAPSDFVSYDSVLGQCFKSPRAETFHNVKIGTFTQVEKCLMTQKGELDWFCLTKYPNELTVPACLFAAQRNKDVTNSDNMRWYCWDQLRNQMRINQAQCLAISKSMNALGNRIKSNWNCMNMLYR